MGFDDHPCDNQPAHYVQLEIWGYPVANPRWEGKLCRPCLAGWRQWAAEEPEAILIISTSGIVTN